MKIVVHLFARARDLAGTSTLSVELPDKATVGDLRRLMAELVPHLGRLLERSAIAIDDELAADTATLVPGMEVALLPPVSGG